MVGRDPGLRSEFESALSGISGLNPVAHFVDDYRQGIESARSRLPDLVCVEMERDLRLLKAFTEDLAIAAPQASIAAVYRRDIFGPEDSEGAVLIEAMRSRVQDFLRRPLSSAELEQLLTRLLQSRDTATRVELGSVVSFISNKGGVGKSTLSVNLACSLARRFPDRVLLVDASLQLGVCAAMLDLSPETSIVDAVREKDRLDEMLIRRLSVPHECGLRLLAAPADAVEAAEVDDESIALVLSMARRAYDFVVVDTFPMIDAVVMAILDLSDLTYFVMQGSVPTVVGASRYLEILQRVGFPKERIRIVLSRNHPGFSGNVRPHDIARRLGRDIDYIVPYTKRAMIAVNTGHPLALRAVRLFGFGRHLGRIADEVTSRRVPVRAKERVPAAAAPAGEETHLPAEGSPEAGAAGSEAARPDTLDAQAEQALRDKVRAWRS